MSTYEKLTAITDSSIGGEQAVVAYTYDDLGQLTGKTYGTGVYAIHETMDYNIQGWLTEKSSELFEMNLRYFNPRRDWVAASYTGNITEWKWQHKQVDGATLCDDYTYAYTYDNLGRLQSADLYSRDDDTLDGAVSGFSERMSYDKNSNILTLNRRGSPDENVQSYGFEYIGNQRTKERNSNSSYGYDGNGNMTEDALAGFGMSYNILNLPEYIQDNWGSGEISHRYSYLADGTKMSIGDYENSGYQYAGSLVYSMDYGTVNSFESASFGGGRIVGTNDGTSSEVHYFLTDHLGSTRVVAKVTLTGREDLDRKDYYPFGKAWAQPDMPTSDNRYTFSGKEKQHLRFQEIDYADFGARFYDSDGVHFLQQDPLLEKYFRIGQYNYCAGNPVKYVDPNGSEIRIYFFDDDGNSHEIVYQANMEYMGNNTFVSNVITLFNAVYNNGGAKVLDALISDNNSIISVTSEVGCGTMSFTQKGNGEGVIKAGNSISDQYNDYQKIEGAAHELFHAVQYLEGQGGSSVINEVEAYTFSIGIAQQYATNKGDYYFSTNSLGNSDNSTYEQALNNLIKNGYSQESFYNAVVNFKGQSQSNAQGLYNAIPIKRPNQNHSMLKKYYRP